MQIKSILVPADFSSTSGAALDLAWELASQLHASLTVLHVSGAASDQEGEALMTAEREAHAKLERYLEPRGVPSFEVALAACPGEPKKAIVAWAHAHAVDLIVMGTHSRSGLERFIMGSVAESVLRNAPCPVPVTRA
ncbi:MAG: universal stress protein [Acidobacteriota bacterium]